MAKKRTFGVTAAVLLGFSSAALSDAQSDFDRNMKNAERVYERLEKERIQKEMRDTRHDGRLKIGPDTSVGGSITPPSVNIMTTTP